MKKVEHQNKLIQKVALRLDQDNQDALLHQQYQLEQREKKLQQEQQMNNLQSMQQQQQPPSLPFQLNQKGQQGYLQQNNNDINNMNNNMLYNNNNANNNNNNMFYNQWLQQQQFYMKMQRQQQMTNLMSPLGHGMNNEDILKSVGLIKNNPMDQNNINNQQLSNYQKEKEAKKEAKKKKAQKKRDEAKANGLRKLKSKVALLQLKKDKHKRYLKTFRKVVRRVQFVIWYFRNLQQRFISRFNAYQERSSIEIGKVLTLTSQWLLSEKGFSKAEDLLYDPKLKLELTGPKQLNQKENLKRIEQSIKICKAYMDGILSISNEESMGSELISFLGFWTHDYQFPPQQFLFKFEVDRLNFSSYGQLIEQKPWKSMMVIGCLTIIRFLLHKRLLRPNLINPPKQAMGGQFQVNSKTVVSILYHVFMELVIGEVPRQFDNQEKVDIAYLCKSKSGSLEAEDNSEAQVDEEGPEEDCLIKGLFSKSQLQDVFIDHREKVEHLKALVNCFLTEVFELVQSKYVKTEKALI